MRALRCLAWCLVVVLACKIALVAASLPWWVPQAAGGLDVPGRLALTFSQACVMLHTQVEPGLLPNHCIGIGVLPPAGITLLPASTSAVVLVSITASQEQVTQACLLLDNGDTAAWEAGDTPLVHLMRLLQVLLLLPSTRRHLMRARMFLDPSEMKARLSEFAPAPRHIRKSLCLHRDAHTGQVTAAISASAEALQWWHTSPFRCWQAWVSDMYT